MGKGIIYKVESPSGKVYIGQTICTLKKRKREHLRKARDPNNNTKFAQAIRKYGEKMNNWQINRLENKIDSLKTLVDGLLKKINNLETELKTLRKMEKM